MAFVNEVISDADIDRYQLPFRKGDGRYWTRDAERDMYLWGGFDGNPAFGEDFKWIFDFYIHGHLLTIYMDRGQGSVAFSESPFIVIWNKVLSIRPSDCFGLNREEVIHCLKEALIAYGRNGMEHRRTPIMDIQFKF